MLAVHGQVQGEGFAGRRFAGAGATAAAAAAAPAGRLPPAHSTGERIVSSFYKSLQFKHKRLPKFMRRKSFLRVRIGYE